MSIKIPAGYTNFVNWDKYYPDGYWVLNYKGYLTVRDQRLRKKRLIKEHIEAMKIDGYRG